MSHCMITVDLESLKPFVEKLDRNGLRYRIQYEVTMSFGGQFQVLHQGQVMGGVRVKYI